MKPKTLQSSTIFIFSLILFLTLTQSLPLSTNSRWIVDTTTGRRVKLKCINWAGHMQTMLVEGLDKRPLQDIVAHIVSLGFNCVRLTWATYMFTRLDYANLTASTSLDSLDLSNAKMGFEKKNPSLLNLTIIQVQGKVVDELGRHGLMVILDNHVSKPKWCCGNNDGNGFFGDRFFDPDEWLQGLNLVANRYKAKTQVIGMSMRNELRGSSQNKSVWYKFIKKGAERIHKANPNLLIIASGLNFATDLSFLKNKTLGTNLNNKLVYEAHWYSFSGNRRKWTTQPLNQVCKNTMSSFDKKAGFLVEGENPFPLFLSEFGVDQRGVNKGDNRFLACFMAYAVEKDLDWALWALQGSYYMKNSVVGPDETYGVLDFNWAHKRNPKFHDRYRLAQTMIQEPRAKNKAYQILYHPESGHCIRRTSKNNIKSSDCKMWDRWSYEGDGKPIRLIGTSLCLQALGAGRPVRISTDCFGQMSKWQLVSGSKLHIATQDGKGNHLCLQAKSSNSSILFTKKCICFGDDDNCLINPQSQWFKLIYSTLD